MHHIRTPNTVVFPLSSVTWAPAFWGSRSPPVENPFDLLEVVPSLDHCSQQSCSVGIFWLSLSAIYRGKEICFLVALLHDLVQTRSSVFFIFLKAFLANINSVRQISQINYALKLYSAHLKAPLICASSKWRYQRHTSA
ncbi:hypothetical protein TNCV_1401481 [Trichonephila clavipes]|nr:hypothetical protein TNCV_1401481 [Trichonephila clavipes]